MGHTKQMGYEKDSRNLVSCNWTKDAIYFFLNSLKEDILQGWEKLFPEAVCYLTPSSPKYYE